MLAHKGFGKEAKGAERGHAPISAAEALAREASVWLKQGQAAEAAQALEQALRLRPDWPELHNSLAVARRLQGHLDEALARCREAVRLAPDMAEARNNLGSMLSEQGKLEEAIGSLRDAIRLKPGFANAHSNLGVVCYRQHRYADAVAEYRQALAYNPAFAEAHNNLGSVLFDLGQAAEALASFNEAIRLQPDYRQAHLGRALVWLSRGDYEQGWPEFEWRLPAERSSPGDVRRWTGDELAGRTLLLKAEQGLGDTLQFIRFASLVRRGGGRVVLACQPQLAPLLAASCPMVDQVVSQAETSPTFDVHLPLLSLPGLFGKTLASVPADIPYLHPKRSLVEKWRAILSGVPGLKIGIAWQGNPQYHGDPERSFPLGEFEPLARVPNVRLISLQKGPGTEQLLAARRHFPVIEFDPLDEITGPFMDSAAMMKNLGLVITCDSAICHLAGALGVRTWAAIAAAPDWRWLQHRDDSPWYPTLRLFRQPKLGDWKSVFDHMAHELLTAANARRTR
ncbi:MAG TPA: tetratricopeptide repeat-containing glycosyltransferase family protein [Pirellulales bacterium]|nr:tetratricopeptide repeat-containing glycosyltransferase family protein [Pirellulales bacterium]